MFKGLFGKKEKNNKLYAPLKGEGSASGNN